MRCKMQEKCSQVKWVTHGILFDVHSAITKPESYGSLKEIANVLKENPDLKIKIVGHTGHLFSQRTGYATLGIKYFPINGNLCISFLSIFAMNNANNPNKMVAVPTLNIQLWVISKSPRCTR